MGNIRTTEIINVFFHEGTIPDANFSKTTFRDNVQFKNVSDFKTWLQDRLNKDQNFMDQKLCFFIHIKGNEFSEYVKKHLKASPLILSELLRTELLHLYPAIGNDWFFITSDSEYEYTHTYQIKNICTYGQVIKVVSIGTLRSKTVNDLLEDRNDTNEVITASNSMTTEVFSFDQKTYPDCEYAIITALEEDEMEKVLPMIVKTGSIKNDKHLIEYGHLKSKPEKKIAYASQQSTGMIDAAILSTELLIRFRPKFLIMAGVLGGKPNDVNIGDIIVATKVFTIDKGKIAKRGFEKEIESSTTDSSYVTKFKREKKNIISYIRDSDPTRNKPIDIHFGSIACVRQVVDLAGYFEEIISPEDRKAIALEMESYGISRACELVNDGHTTPLIIKSAMDNTKDKVNDAKTYAAWTSAMFVRYIFENDLI